MRKNYADQNPNKKSLIRAIIKTFRSEYTLSFLIGTFMCLLDMLSPFLIQQLILFLQNPGEDITHGYVLIAILVST
jgi:hypothetical protein